MKSKDSFLRKVLAQKEIGAALPLAILLICVFVVNKSFYRPDNIFDILRTTAFSVFLAIPVTFLMAAGGMDLSIGAVVSIGGVIVGSCIKAGMPISIAILITAAAGLLIGFLNGFMIVRCKLPAFIATLAMQYCINGLNNVWTGGLSINNLPAAFKLLGQYRLGGKLSITVLYAFILVVIGHIILTRAKAGRTVLAVGGNKECAHLAGINVVRTQIIIYMITGFFSAMTGMLYAARFGAVQTSIGNGIELTTIAAVIVGGTSMFGGSASLIGAVLGCLLLSTISNALVLMKVSVYWQTLIFGVILIAALYIDRYRQKILQS